ncbi:hypothetical protein [uncultured Dysosmobacter sp.]|uniref:hypothetical protein n=1 Tax=uncultured Dysosmobacter sp. TaxID=2591384 RepID=UPI00261F8FEE|nr:hypothetical protein [uncultured Dysosmobacter sp.]
MELLKKPLLRVPLVLGIAGIVLRFLTYIAAFISVRLQTAQGPDPVTGAYSISSGYVTEIMAVISFVVFWAAGWKFVRGLERKTIFFSATIMVVWCTALLIWEQLSQKLGGYSLWCYRFYATTEANMWATQILIRIFDTVSVPVVLPSLFVPYLYLLLGKRGSRQVGAVEEAV